MKMNRSRLIPGLILIALGIVLLLVQYIEFGPGLVLVLLGLVFLAGYAGTRSYGVLIPGCILGGLGLGIMFQRPPFLGDAAPLIGLGLGFCAIFAIQLIVAGRPHWWPLVPGALLVVAGILTSWQQGQLLLERGWPLILIAAGLFVLAAQFRRPGIPTEKRA